MRVNSRVFSERTDMFSGIKIPNCPSQFKVIAENLMDMVTKPGYDTPHEHSMTELDKILMRDYWIEYDGFGLYPLNESAFSNWFIHKATAPELVRRSRQWLAEHHYIIPEPSVSERAFEAGEKFSKAIKK